MRGGEDAKAARGKEDISGYCTRALRRMEMSSSSEWQRRVVVRVVGSSEGAATNRR